MIGKCPYCQQLIGTVNVQPIDAYEGTKTWKAGVFTCPNCSSILNVSIDEGHRAQWIVDQIKDALSS
ncbi:MAG: hypothetical protein A2167_06370 [Planctomycetes bacterium RBG_13_46_10]|nr:MAG: hypothetical protein A2167_06370 [Planctomycetes bacterium RBG_13_46_10]